MTQNRVVSTLADSYIPGKNFILNGAFDFWQRGTSVTAGNGLYTADRWCTFTDSQTRTVSRQLTSDTTNLPDIRYCARFQRPNGDTGTGRLVIGSGLETSDSILLVGETVTFSFYARAGANFSSSGSSLLVYLQYGTGIDQNVFVGFTGQANLVGESKTITTSWQRFSVTGTIPTNATQVGYQVLYTPTGTAGANDYFEITGAQLEIGSVPTKFSRNSSSLQGELAACQRYYWRTGTDSIYGAFGNGFCKSTTAAYITMVPPVTMRVPTTAIDGTTVNADYATYDGVTVTAVTGIGLDRPTKNVISLAVTGTGLTAYRPIALISNNTLSAYLGFTAEL